MCAVAIQDKNESDMLNATQLDEFLLSSAHKEKKIKNWFRSLFNYIFQKALNKLL